MKTPDGIPTIIKYNITKKASKDYQKRTRIGIKIFVYQV